MDRLTDAVKATEARLQQLDKVIARTEGRLENLRRDRERHQHALSVMQELEDRELPAGSGTNGVRTGTIREAIYLVLRQHPDGLEPSAIREQASALHGSTIDAEAAYRALNALRSKGDVRLEEKLWKLGSGEETSPADAIL